MKLLWRTVVNAIAIAVAANFVPGIAYGIGQDPIVSLVLTGLALGVVNAVVKPIFVLLSVPVTCATLGLFLLVINGAMLLLVSQIGPLGFSVDGWLPAIIGALVVSVVSFILSRLLPD